MEFAQAWAVTGRGKDAPWKSPKADFSTELGNPAEGAGFPLSHAREPKPGESLIIPGLKMGGRSSEHAWDNVSELTRLIDVRHFLAHLRIGVVPYCFTSSTLAVLGPSVFPVVRGYRGERAHPLRVQPRGCGAVFCALSTFTRTSARKIHVGSELADVVGVPDHVQLESRLLLQKFCNFLESRV
jgi:hypothetical protein